MGNITWKSFRLDELFTFDSGNQLSLNKKALDVSDDKNGEYTVALITQSEKNNGISGYLAENDEISSKKMKRYLTYSMHFGLCFYHNYDFVLMDTHGSVFRLLANNTNLKKILDVEDSVNYFISMIITHVCSNEIYNYSWLPNSSRVGREIILLPCLEVSDGEDFIWEENGKHYTLAVEYIKKLMDEAKELREQKTIRLYEAERAKYEAERAKYEAGYKKERDVLLWKGFKLDDLYLFDSSRQYPFTQKQVDITADKDEEHDIAVIAQSAQNNGIIGYLKRNESTEKYIFNDSMTFSMNFGICFYHSYDYLLLDTHGSIFRLIAKNAEFAKATKNKLEVNLYLAKMINKICSKSLYDWQWKPNSQRAGRELILLPCLEVSDGEDFIWEENGKHYTLAVDYISYVYLTGRVNYNQKRIDNYTYQY